MCVLQKLGLIFVISKIIKITIVICKINKKRKLQITKTGKNTSRAQSTDASIEIKDIRVF